MLRKIRITLALLFFTSVTALFLDFTGTLHAWLGWTAKVQFLPALLALNVGVVAALVVLTLLLGRIYCSVICPLGVLQDVFSWISSRRRQKKNRFSYSKEKAWLRYGVLALFITAIAAGFVSIAALIAPYSAYGRIAENLFAPLYRLGNNLLAMAAAHMESYAFYDTEVWIKSVPTLVIACVTLVVIAVASWRNGRIYCNTICPVGTMLGLLSRFSLLRPIINKERCRNCNLCACRCKASCIDLKNHTIDHSRCVACMDCLGNCRHDALHLEWRFAKDSTATKAQDGNEKDGEKVDSSRRSFLSATALLASAAALKAQEKKIDGGLAVIEDKEVPRRNTPIVPPGAGSIANFSQHCTACQLCVSSCPNGVLRPSTDIMRLMQPEMSYERGYCRPECVRCSSVCPTGAIRPLSVEDKSSTRIGRAVWVRKNCIPLTDGMMCDNCARHCPSGAIQMVSSDPNDEESPMIPVVNEERCIGCGACENLCPARPFSAIYVEGRNRHSTM